MQSQSLGGRIIPHVFLRLRERWPDARHLSDSQISESLHKQLTDGYQRRIKAPGGDYVPFTLMGQDGYIVYKDGKIKTVMPAEWCTDINEIRIELQGEH